MPDPVPAPARVSRPLLFTLGGLGLLAALAPLLVTAGLLTNINADVVRADARALHAAVASDVGHAIEGELAEARAGLDAARLALVDASRPGSERIALATSLVAANRSLDHLAIYGADGRRMDVIAEEGAHVDLPLSLPADVVDRLSTGFVVGPVRTSWRPQEPGEVLLAAPITVGDQTTGAVASWVSLIGVQNRVERLAQASLPGFEDALFVTDRTQRYVAHVDVRRAVALTSAAAEPLVAGLSGAGDDALDRGFVTEAEATTSDGVDVVGSVVTLSGPARGFMVVAQMPRERVYASLYRMRALAGVVVVLASLVAALGAFLVARTITRPIQGLVRSADALARRRFADVTADTGTRNELAILGTAMATAARDLQSGEARLLEETRLREGLGRYLPGPVVDAWVNKTDELLQGRRAEVTVLFADVVGFTPLSARLPPEELCQLLNDLFTILTEIVFKHGGTVDKFIGDSVMAFWGAPQDQPDHPERAIEAAKDMLRFLDVGNLRWKKRHGVEIQLAIGVNTGAAVVGNLGSEKRLVYTAIGEAVNIAARLESVAGPMQILTSRATRDRVPHGEFVAVGEKDLSGVAHRVDVFAVEV